MLISFYTHIYGTSKHLRLYRVCTTYVRMTSKQSSLFRTHLVLHTKKYYKMQNGMTDKLSAFSMLSFAMSHMLPAKGWQPHLLDVVAAD